MTTYYFLTNNNTVITGKRPIDKAQDYLHDNIVDWVSLFCEWFSNLGQLHVSGSATCGSDISRACVSGAVIWVNTDKKFLF